MFQHDSKPIVLGKNGKLLLIVGGLIKVLVGGSETNDRYALVEATIQPGNGMPLLHIHPQQETFHVTEGRFEMYGLDEHGSKYVVPAPPGSTIHIPVSVPHAFLNVGDTPGKVLFIYEPAGNMERFFQETGIPVADKANPPVLNSPLDMEAYLKVCARYSIYFLESPQD